MSTLKRTKLRIINEKLDRALEKYAAKEITFEKYTEQVASLRAERMQVLGVGRERE